MPTKKPTGYLQDINGKKVQIKYYVLLTNKDLSEIIFPFKATVNIWLRDSQKRPSRPPKPSFAGGFPAMFGGNLEKEHNQSYVNTLKDEVEEESRKTYSVKDNKESNYTALAADLDLVPQKDKSGKIIYWNDMRFYHTDLWEKIGEWPTTKPTKFAEGEMQTVITLSVNNIITEANNSNNKDKLLEALIKLAKQKTGIEGSAEQKKQFMTSHTATAFTMFLQARMSARRT
ncbi:MAG: hypothetical protein F6K14_16610 [Symploca sp. SIO2C1]|nr:hypothetical protein [Symploca sp. SIO2C1]